MGMYIPGLKHGKTTLYSRGAHAVVPSSFYLTPPLGLEKKKPLIWCQRGIEMEAQEPRPMWWQLSFIRVKKQSMV